MYRDRCITVKITYPAPASSILVAKRSTSNSWTHLSQEVFFPRLATCSGLFWRPFKKWTKTPYFALANQSVLWWGEVSAATTPAPAAYSATNTINHRTRFLDILDPRIQGLRMNSPNPVREN